MRVLKASKYKYEKVFEKNNLYKFIFEGYSAKNI
jgi:hypothetical protein